MVQGSIGKVISLYKNHVIDTVLISHQMDNLKPIAPKDGTEQPPKSCEKCGVEFGMFTYYKLCRLCG